MRDFTTKQLMYVSFYYFSILFLVACSLYDLVQGTITGFTFGYVFALFYNNRIGDIFTTIPPVNNVGLLRTNVGKARILGVESLIDFNLKKVFEMNNEYSFNLFLNSSFINSEYTASQQNGIVGKKVEFVPDVNIKTGVRFGYQNFLASLQYSYLSQQFNDASNSQTSDIANVLKNRVDWGRKIKIIKQ